MVMDHCGGDKEENLPTYIPDCSMSDLNRGQSQPPTLVDVHSSEPSTSISPQPPLPDSVPLSSQHDPAAATNSEGGKGRNPRKTFAPSSTKSQDVVARFCVKEEEAEC